MPDERVPAGGKESNEVVKDLGRAAGAIEQVRTTSRSAGAQARRPRARDEARRKRLLALHAEWARRWSGRCSTSFARSHSPTATSSSCRPTCSSTRCGYAAGQFPKFVDDVYHLETGAGERPAFLLPTSETAILNMYRDEILEAEDSLPIKSFAYTPVTGASPAGTRSEERGTIRGHQFNKVEVFQFVAPEDAESALEELVGKAERSGRRSSGCITARRCWRPRTRAPRWRSPTTSRSGSRAWAPTRRCPRPRAPAITRRGARTSDIGRRRSARPTSTRSTRPRSPRAGSSPRCSSSTCSRTAR